MKNFRLLASVGSLLTLCTLFGCQSKQSEDKLVAQVGSEKIYQSDVDFLKRTNHLLNNPDMQKNVLEMLLEERAVFQEAKKYLGEDSSIAQRMNDLEKRFLSRAYEDFYINQNLAHTDEQLQKYFEKNKNFFEKDSCRRVEDCRLDVAVRLYDEEHSQELLNYKQKAIAEQAEVSADLVYVESEDSNAVKSAAEMMRANISYDSIPGLKRGTFSSSSQDEFLKNEAVRQLLFRDDLLAIGETRFVSGTKSVAMKLLLRRKNETFPEDKRDSILEYRFAFSFKDLMANKGDSVLQDRYKFRFEPIVYPEVKKYYDEHAEEFKGASVEDVAEQIERKITGDQRLELDPDYVLATLDGKPVIRERDVQVVLDDIPKHLRPRFPRRRIVAMLANWELTSMAAKEANLENAEITKKLRLKAKIDLYRKKFFEKFSQEGFGASEKMMQDAYAKYGTLLFPNAKYGQVRSYLALFALTSDNVFRYEYYRKNPNAVDADLDSIKVSVYKTSIENLSKIWFEKYRKTLFEKYPVTVLDSAYLPQENLFSTAVLVAMADSLYNARNLDQARAFWTRAQALATNDSLYARSILELAKLDAERGKFAESEKEYAAFLAMWPESPFAEKAMFARGFQLRENLKKDTAALAVLTQFMEKYPKSDLRESVEWLIKDIQSGGKLSEELNRKISEQE